MTNFDFTTTEYIKLYTIHKIDTFKIKRLNSGLPKRRLTI